MTIHVNIGKAKTNLSQLVDAAMRGEDIVLAKAGKPQVRLQPVVENPAEEIARRAAQRLAAFGMFKHLVGDRDIDVAKIKREDEELQASYRQKFGDPD